MSDSEIIKIIQSFFKKGLTFLPICVSLILMRKPLKFKAGFYTWKIIWSDELVSEMFGKTDDMHKSITIYKHSNKQAERETLFHELLHAVGSEFYESIFNFEPDKKEIDKEENLIRVLSPLLMQVLSDNKDLARYLFKV